MGQRIPGDVLLVSDDREDICGRPGKKCLLIGVMINERFIRLLRRFQTEAENR